MTRPTKEEKAEAKLQYDLTPVTGWRSRIVDWTPLIGAENQALLEKLQEVVYGMVLRGADEKDIVEYFGFDKNVARQQLRPVIEMAKAELRLILKEDQIMTALGSRLPNMKVWVGKQMAGQSDFPALEVGDTLVDTSQGLFQGLTVVRTHRAMDGTTTAEPEYLPVERH